LETGGGGKAPPLIPGIRNAIPYPSLGNQQAEARMSGIEGLGFSVFSDPDGLQVEYCRVAEVRCS